MMGSMPSSYIIIGAGIFGASTALHLKKADPPARILLIDRAPFPNPAAASHDLNKIIRADYEDVLYMKLALEAQHSWRGEMLYKPYYHETGILFAEDMGMSRKCVSNYKALGEEAVAKIITPEEAKARFPGFKDAAWTDVKECYYNPRSGWGEAEPALRGVIQAAIDRGVRYVQATVSRLSMDGKGACTGIQTVDGRELTADHILLCTGPHTAKLIADSAPEDKELQVGGRMVAAAAVSCAAKVAPEHRERFRRLPVFANLMGHTHGLSAACPRFFFANGLICIHQEKAYH
jgi:sarcosine oxidase / L-pipecolate oxidase